ncbi:hypothetical protein M2323_004705, partial [Rhodoblastus acidophilus]|uniref:pre-peptidase C-terminal domain-containing protein n=1 Tax=Rhodoblastus acidophilus TaxID=1074 RepID=UPI00222556C1
TLATATSLGALSTTAATASDWVGNAAPNDYYQFTLSALSNVTLKLSGLANANGYLYLLNSSGGQITSTYYGYTNGALTANLAAGTYYINVNDTYDTAYTLSASATALPNAAGATLATATSVGALGATAIVKSDWIGSAASTDYYAFSVSASTLVSLKLATANGVNGTIYLLNSSGGQIASSYYGAGGLTSIVSTLAAGTYYAEVASSSDSSYSLTFSTGTAAVGSSATDGAGNTLAAAKAIGALASTAKTYADWVGATDATDVYQFTLSSLSSVTLQLSGLASGAFDTFTLYDANGAQLDYTYAASNYNGLISDNLAAGTYYAVIASSGGSDTGYNFSASATALPNATGTTLASATSLGALGTTAVVKSDWIGQVAPNDYYSFTLGALATVSFTFTGAWNGSSTLALLDSAGNQITSAYPYNVSTQYALSATLAAGTYYLRLSDSYDTAYTLTAVSSAAAGTAPALTAGRSLAGAASLGALSATAVAKTDWVGDAAPDEWFKFTVGAP